MMPAWPDLTPEEWRQRVAALKTEKRYNPDQPRDPAGTPTGGRWTATGGLSPELLALVPKDAQLLVTGGWQKGNIRVVPHPDDRFLWQVQEVDTGHPVNLVWSSKDTVEDVFTRAAELADQPMAALPPWVKTPEGPAPLAQALREEQDRVLREFANSERASARATQERDGIREAIEELPIVVQMHPSDLEEVLDDSEHRIRNQHETGTSNGAKLGQERERFEYLYFFGETGIPLRPTVEYDQFPIYGSLSFPDEAFSGDSGTSHYGNVALVLNDRLRGKTTWTVGDSWDNNGMRQNKFPFGDGKWSSLALPLVDREGRYDPLRAVPMDYLRAMGRGDFSLRGGATSALEAIRETNIMGRYFEAQIHGGFTLSDVKEIVVSRTVRDHDFDTLRQRLWDEGFDHLTIRRPR